MSRISGSKSMGRSMRWRRGDCHIDVVDTENLEVCATLSPWSRAATKVPAARTSFARKDCRRRLGCLAEKGRNCVSSSINSPVTGRHSFGPPHPSFLECGTDASEPPLCGRPRDLGGDKYRTRWPFPRGEPPSTGRPCNSPHLCNLPFGRRPPEAPFGTAQQ